MATLQQRIEGYIGTVTGSATAIQDAMSSEARILIDAIPAFDLIQDGASDTATIRTEQDQFAVDDVRILDVMVSYPTHTAALVGPYKAIQIPRSESGKMLDPNSLHYRKQFILSSSDGIVRDPVYFIEKIEDFPAGDTYSHVRTIPQPSLATNEVSVIIEHIPYPSISLSDANLYEIPKKILQALVFYGVIQELSNRVQVDIADLATAFYDASGLTLPTSPIANLPAAPLLTFNAVTPTSVVATNISAVTPPIPPSSPGFTYTDAVASTVFGINISSITSLANTLSVPSAPFFTYTDVTSNTYDEADAALDEVDTIIQDLASSSITLPILSVSYADFNTAMTNGDIELAQSYLSQIQTELSEYQAESQTAINEFTALNARRYDSSINHAINKVDAYLKRLQDISSRADSVALQNEARELERQVSEYRADLDLYTQDLNKYQADVQKLVQATQIELEQLRTNAQLETDVSVQNEARTLEAQISEYQSSLSLYQAELNEHQIEVQKAITQAQLTQERLVETAQRTDNLAIQDEARRLEKEVSEYRLELERFGTEIQTYGQELQSYGLQLQSKVSEANDKMQRKTLEIQSLNADRQYYDAMYAQELQKLGVVQANG